MSQPVQPVGKFLHGQISVLVQPEDQPHGPGKDVIENKFQVFPSAVRIIPLPVLQDRGLHQLFQAFRKGGIISLPDDQTVGILIFQNIRKQDAHRIRVVFGRKIACQEGHIFLYEFVFDFRQNIQRFCIVKIESSPAGWTMTIILIAVPMAFIGILRFFFVKETVEVKDASDQEGVKMKDALLVLRKNPYVWMVGLMYFGYMLVTGMGINTYFFTHVMGDIKLMSSASAIAIVALPLLVVFPALMKRMTKGMLVQAVLLTLSRVCSGFSVIQAIPQC